MRTDLLRAGADPAPRPERRPRPWLRPPDRTLAAVLAAAGLARLLPVVLPAGAAAAPEPLPPASAPAPAADGVVPATPELATGSVTLPYPELRALWRAAHPPPPAAPPVPYSVQSARYVLEFGGPDGRRVRGRATFEVLVLAAGWVAVPLLPPAAIAADGADGGPADAIRLTGTEPPDALVASVAGEYCLLCEQPGRRTVTLRFETALRAGSAAAPGTGAPEPAHPGLRLAAVPALHGELVLVNVPATDRAVVADASPVLPGPAGETTAGPAAPDAPGPDAPARTWSLVSDHPLSLTLVPAAEADRPAAPPVPSRWRVESQSLARRDEGQLVYRTRLLATAETGTGRDLEVDFPAAVNLSAVGGADLDRWQLLPRAEPGGNRRLQVTWKTPGAARRELFVSYELPWVDPAADWPLTVVRAVPGRSELAGTLAVLPLVDGQEFVPVAGGDRPGAAPPAAAAGDPRTLPRWLGAALAGSGFVALSAPGNAPLAVRARALPLVPTAQASVEEAAYRTRLVTDGALLSEGILKVRHRSAPALSLTLPAGAQLLACSVDGRETTPVDRGAGRIGVPLPPPPPASAADPDAPGTPPERLSAVAFRYLARARPLAPVAGQVALTLPRADLFVRVLTWELLLPEAYELTALEGNVELVTAPAAPAAPSPDPAPPPVSLRKELLKDEIPTVEVFYQKRHAQP